MSVSMALFSPPRLSSSLLNPNFAPRSPLCLLRKPHSLRASADNGSSPLAAAIAVESPKSETATETAPTPAPTAEISAVDENGAVDAKEAKINASKFEDTRWVNGTWDLKQFLKDGSTDWDAVIDAEARRRKWLEDNPETTSNDDPVLFDTSIIPWWAWIKRYHLPEAELLNGRAAMVGFFMAYFVDSLTGVGLVDQMGNFFCKTLLFVAVAGVLLIRKNSDVENLKKLVEETTFYDRQWQAAWKEDKTE